VLRRVDLRHPARQPGGAFYLWVDVRDAGTSSQDLALNLLRHHRVAVAPGTAFGDEGEGWVRISLANSEEAIRAGMSALADTVRG
jgi:aspartate aminotransferase